MDLDSSLVTLREARRGMLVTCWLGTTAGFGLGAFATMIAVLKGWLHLCHV